MVFRSAGACIEKGTKKSYYDLGKCAAAAFLSFKEGVHHCVLRNYNHPPCINEDGEYYCEGFGPACNECPDKLPAYRY